MTTRSPVRPSARCYAPKASTSFADIKADAHALAATRALHPEVTIVDVRPGADTGFSITRPLCSLPAPPVVIITSSADREQFGAKINSYRFIAKQTSLPQPSPASQTHANRPDRIQALP